MQLVSFLWVFLITSNNTAFITALICQTDYNNIKYSIAVLAVVVMVLALVLIVVVVVVLIQHLKIFFFSYFSEEQILLLV